MKQEWRATDKKEGPRGLPPDTQVRVWIDHEPDDAGTDTIDMWSWQRSMRGCITAFEIVSMPSHPGTVCQGWQPIAIPRNRSSDRRLLLI